MSQQQPIIDVPADIIARTLADRAFFCVWCTEDESKVAAGARPGAKRFRCSRELDQHLNAVHPHLKAETFADQLDIRAFLEEHGKPDHRCPWGCANVFEGKARTCPKALTTHVKNNHRELIPKEAEVTTKMVNEVQCRALDLMNCRRLALSPALYASAKKRKLQQQLDEDELKLPSDQQRSSPSSSPSQAIVTEQAGGGEEKQDDPAPSLPAPPPISASVPPSASDAATAAPRQVTSDDEQQLLEAIDDVLHDDLNELTQLDQRHIALLLANQPAQGGSLLLGQHMFDDVQLQNHGGGGAGSGFSAGAGAGGAAAMMGTLRDFPQNRSSQSLAEMSELSASLSERLVIQNGGPKAEVRFVPTELSTKCAVCDSQFSWLWRRTHNCRRCGNCVCSACSPNRIAIPEWKNATEEVRVCNSCVEQMDGGAEPSSPPSAEKATQAPSKGGDGGPARPRTESTESNPMRDLSPRASEAPYEEDEGKAGRTTTMDVASSPRVSLV